MLVEDYGIGLGLSNSKEKTCSERTSNKTKDLNKIDASQKLIQTFSN